MPATTVAELSAALNRARSTASFVKPPEGYAGALEPAVARAVANELYRSAATERAWKMGAFDAETQDQLGLDEPLVAPVLSRGLVLDASFVDLHSGDFVQPRLEAEIGVLVTETRVRALPCVEVADCRIAGWRPPPGWALADFGLQGAMVFGTPVEPPDSVSVEVVHDGTTVGIAQRCWADALARLEHLPADAGHAVPFRVATGAMTPLYELALGRWEFRFSGLPALTLVVS